MSALVQVDTLLRNLLALGPRRLAALGLIGSSVIAIVALAGYFLSRPSMVPLYSGLDRDDVVSIGSALRQAGISFDVNAGDTAIVVPAGKAALARMTLAEKGLPHSGTEGDELFDKLGSLGLTSFMQRVTRVRALEGELARTIQMMRGVKAARVHVVLGDEGTFRSDRTPPSASVVIRTDESNDRTMAVAIRHLVAAAVPGMTPAEVTVLDVNGLLLASGSDSVDQEPSNMLDLEKKVSQDIRKSISKTLAPYLTMRNFQVSVAAILDTDKTKTQQTTYDPDSRVERSVRIIRETQNTQDSSAQPPTSVTQNLPQPQGQANNSKQSTDDSQKREELTNYEISSKTVTTQSSGFSIKRLSVAVLVNRAAFVGADGKALSPDAIQKQVADIQQLVTSAAGLQKARGDDIKISVVNFADTSKELQPEPGPSLMDQLAEQAGPLIDGGSILLVSFLLIWFGIRPVTRALLAQPAAPALVSSSPQALAAPEPSEQQAVLPASENAMLIESSPANKILQGIEMRKERSAGRYLEQLIEYDEVQAAAVLKQWMRKGAEA